MDLLWLIMWMRQHKPLGAFDNYNSENELVAICAPESMSLLQIEQPMHLVPLGYFICSFGAPFPWSAIAPCCWLK